MLKIFLFIAVLIIIFNYCTSLEYPIVREFKNSKLTFKNAGELS